MLDVLIKDGDRGQQQRDAQGEGRMDEHDGRIGEQGPTQPAWRKISAGKKTTNAMTNCTRLKSTVASGRISRGKRIFFTRLASEIIEPVEALTEQLKKIQGKIPVMRKSV